MIWSWNGRKGVDCFYNSQIWYIWPASTWCPAEMFKTRVKLRKRQDLAIWMLHLLQSVTSDCHNVTLRCHICPVYIYKWSFTTLRSVTVYSLMLMFCWVYKAIYPLGMVMRHTMTGNWVRVMLLEGGVALLLMRNVSVCDYDTNMVMTLHTGAIVVDDIRILQNTAPSNCIIPQFSAMSPAPAIIHNNSLSALASHHALKSGVECCVWLSSKMSSHK